MDTMKAVFVSSLFLISSISAQKQKVLLFLIDGLRYDQFGYELPAFHNVEMNGVRAEWMDGAFVSLSAPSMYTIATGLHPECHGVVHNLYYDPETGAKTTSYSATLNVSEWWDTGAEPIWVTAKLNGLSVGNIMYPGGMKEVKGIVPDKIIPSDSWWWWNMPLSERIDLAMEWLIEDDFDLVLLYADKPDTISHTFGTDSPAVKASLDIIDANVQKLFDLIEENGLTDILNVIMVSDHGHINFRRGKQIRLYDYINETDLDFHMANYGPTFQLLPKEGKMDKVYDALKDKVEGMNIYKKAEFPERLHYANHPRILPILGFVEPGWFIYTDPLNIQQDVDRIFGSQHGYDTRHMAMKSYFMAKGPFFKEGYRASPISSVDIYGMMCDILNLPEAPNNGSRARYVDMLKEDQEDSPQFYVIVADSVFSCFDNLPFT
ncbi:putative ectonucleotide pyrophosphatase/phosphodiesterase family member 7-like [Apostichopus japonicus]|uniref:Putative ectonucleotide pyrophosphatase/phosphodiesterase family member 7-like n=1 Tax=Stichopus japonicus TaxID=307972 RepID=A0A2G8KKD5_STIJA|nr:putative ectonucleotide pyrophosphatase/phosphodiesterase family member 7-like [Apostichopus japonicus]